MDMLQLIEILNEQTSPACYCIVMIDQRPLKLWADDPDEIPYKQMSPQKETWVSYNKEEAISFLFDKDVFGWEIKSWDFNLSDFGTTSFTIELYRFNA